MVSICSQSELRRYISQSTEERYNPSEPERGIGDSNPNTE